MSRRQQATSSDDAESKRRRQESELRQAFRVFDIDGDGLIDAEELRQTMANLGESLSDHDVYAMISEADRNGDGKVDFDGILTCQGCRPRGSSEGFKQCVSPLRISEGGRRNNSLSAVSV